MSTSRVPASVALGAKTGLTGVTALLCFSGLFGMILVVGRFAFPLYGIAAILTAVALVWVVVRARLSATRDGTPRRRLGWFGVVQAAILAASLLQVGWHHVMQSSSFRWIADSTDGRCSLFALVKGATEEVTITLYHNIGGLPIALPGQMYAADATDVPSGGVDAQWWGDACDVVSVAPELTGRWQEIPRR